MILNNLKKYSENIAIITKDLKTIKYKELFEEINKFKFKIKDRKKLTFLICTNEIEVIIAYLSFLEIANNKLKGIWFAIDGSVTGWQSFSTARSRTV